jgi:hypothetical protein
MAKKPNPLLGGRDDRPRIWMRENDGYIEWKRDATARWNRGCNSIYDALCMGTEDNDGLEHADQPAIIMWEGSTTPT